MGITKLSPPPQKRKPPAKKPTKLKKIGKSKRTVTASYDTGPNRRDVGKRTFPAKKGKAKTKKRMFGDEGAPRDVSPTGGGSDPSDHDKRPTAPGMSAGRTVPTFNEVVKRKTGGRV